MNTEVEREVTCRDCGENLPLDWANTEEEKPCPECGSLKKTIEIKKIEGK